MMVIGLEEDEIRVIGRGVGVLFMQMCVLGMAELASAG